MDRSAIDMAAASALLTRDVAMHLPPDDLPEFKALLKRFFSSAPWGAEEAEALAALVTPHVDLAWREHEIEGGTLAYGVRDGRFAMAATGGTSTAGSLFDRAFDGPVRPEATPHPRKVRFVFGGAHAPGEWYRRGDEIDDDRLARLFAEADVTDVMVAGDFVTIGLDEPWEGRLEPILALVTELYGGDAPTATPGRTRAELLSEAGDAVPSSEELHLLDPDETDHRSRLVAALDDEDASVRRVAVAILDESADPAVRDAAIESGLDDGTLRVRRLALDAAGDAGDERFREAFERAAVDDPDAWTRWRAVKALGDLGAEPSRAVVESAATDAEFRVRFEAERVLRSSADP